jgi:monoamine oxidase
LQLQLDAMPFQAWLAQQGLNDPQLRWYLDYCCRDDYGAGLATVSAWAGIHYFASRHGFHVPGDEAGEREGVLTWPEGNGWLTQRLAAPLAAAGQLHTAQTVLRIAQTPHGVEVDAFDSATQSVQRWQAERCIVALPVLVAARVLQDPPAMLRERAAALRYAPWVVANVHIDRPLQDRPGAAPSWDNVVYGTGPALQSLGYVDAGHQNLQPVPGATVLSWYLALGDLAQGRRQLLEKPWTHWRDALLADLADAHPDLRQRATRMAITRYGHAMAMPVAGSLQQVGGHAAAATDRLSFAHADWAGYSIFEEAFALGHAAGNRAV